MMRLTIEATRFFGESQNGKGMVFVGETDQGTPVRALICGIQPDSKDPAVAAQLDRECDAIPQPVCEHCGDTDDHEHGGGEMARAQIDPFEIAAIWLRHIDPGHATDPEFTAAFMRENLPEVDPEKCEAVINGTKAIWEYIMGVLLDAPGIPISREVGHA
jgi:hypothetical protein